MMTDFGTILLAADIAARAHAGQTRLGRGGPYVLHPIRVARLLAELGANEIVIAAALLHDVVEDTVFTFDMIQQEFTDRFDSALAAGVVSLVAEVTDDPTLDKHARKRAQVEKAKAGRYSHDASLIKLADKLDNVRSLSTFPPPWRPESIRGYADVCREVVEALRCTSRRHEQLGLAFDDAYARLGRS